MSVQILDSLCFVSMPLYHLYRLAAIPKSNWWTFAEMVGQKRPPRPFLFFLHLAKICQQNCCNGHDLFRSLAKMIALTRRDNLQVLQVCQMRSITSFEPLSPPVVALKFGRSQKKTFSSFFLLPLTFPRFYILFTREWQIFEFVWLFSDTNTCFYHSYIVFIQFFRHLS